MLKTKPITNSLNRVLALVLTIAALSVGQTASAQDSAPWTELQTALTNSSTDANNPTVITLDKDIVATSTDNYLEIAPGHHVIIDLNGHKIDRNLTEADNNGQVFYVRGGTNNTTPSSLTIRDSQGGGIITGGYVTGWNGGGAFFVTYSSTLTIKGGTITGNKSAQYGGGAITATNKSTVRMTGGSITGNVGNTLNNAAYPAAGAVYLNEQSHFYLTGGSITDNLCGGHYKGQDNILYGKDGTGGIGFDSQHDYVNRVHLSGTYTLSGNLMGNYENGTLTTSIASDYLHTQKNVIVIENAINPTAPAVITVSDNSKTQVLTSGWNSYMTTEPTICFTLGSFYNTDGKVIGLRDGNLVIDTPLAALWHADDDHDGSTADKAYIISTPKGLDLLASQVNGTDGYTANRFDNTYFKLGNDITYTHKAANEAGADTENNFTAIGTASNLFEGIFNGQNHTISGIRIYQPNADYQGLFGNPVATIQNVILSDAVITGKECVGSIAGVNNGVIDNCIVRDAVITGNNKVGGIAGYNTREINNCFVDGTNVSGNNPGGAIIGNIMGNPTLQDNYYHGCTRTIGNYTVTTDIGTGYNGDINGARAVFTITAGPDVSFTATVACTYQDVNYYPFRNNTVMLSYTGNTPATGYKTSFSYNDGSDHTLNGNRFSMPAKDITVNVAIVPITYTVRFNKNHDDATGTMDDQVFDYDAAQNLTTCGFRRTGYTFAKWTTNADGTGDSYTDGKSVLNLTATDGNTVTLYAQWTDHWNIANGADGTTAEKAYVINSTTGLDLLASQVNGTDGYTANDFSGKFFKLGNGIAYSGTDENFTAIGTASHPFKGTFNGNGKVISGIRINQGNADYQGLFGYVGTGGTVQNVILTETTITGDENTGAIAGYNEGTLTANYYRSCTVNSQTTNVGTGSGDVTGARSVHTLTFDEDGITTKTAPDIIDNSIGYYAVGTEIILDYIVPTGYIFCNFRKNGSSVGNSFNMPSQDVIVSVYKNPKWGITNNNNGNDGSQEKPYVISDFEDLNVLSMSVNGTDGNTHYVADDCEGKYFILEGLVEAINKKFSNHTAIGSPTHPFNGTFDGHEKVIKGIRIDSGDDYQGLFGYIGSKGTVKNVIVENAVIKNTSGNESHYVGAIIGYNAGTITNNYYLSCTIKNDSVNVGTGSGDVDDALGLHMIIPGEGVVVTGTKHFYINDSQTAFDTGDDYYAVGSTVTLSRAEGYLLGNSGYTATKVNSTEKVPVTENNGVYTFEMPRIRVIVDPLELDKATYWHADADHDGTSEKRAYIISTTTGLNMLANHVYDGHDCKGLFFRLGADIAYDPSAADANGINFLGIGGDFGTRVGTSFNGTFDGQGYTISGTLIHRTTDNVGFFGAIGLKGTVKNMILSDARIKGGNSTGGIAGSNTGTIKNCIVVGTTIIKEYRDHYGVIVGMNSGIISNNYYLGCTYIDGNKSKTSSIGLGDNDEDFEHSGHDQDDDDGALETEAFPLLSSGNNDRAISKYNGVADQDFTLAGRTFYKDGDWNTLCLPFSLSAGQIAAHEYFKDVDIRALSSASFENGTLTLNFTPAAPAEGAVTSIQAGTPYLIKWTKADDYNEGYNHAIYDIRNGTFEKVTITSTTPGAVTSADGKVTFQGTYNYIQYTNEDRSVLFLGKANTLYYPKPRLTDPDNEFNELYNPWVYPNIGAFRAYFQLNGITAGNPEQGVRAINLNFGDEDDKTGITTTNYTNFTNSDDAWYDLSGRKLSGRPNAKGLYIVNGKKVVIK